MSINTPVAMLVFNRPDTTRRVFESVRQAAPPQLLVVADGPRADRPEEGQLCKEVRAVFDEVDWDCDLRFNISDSNLGCKQRIFTGLDWVFSNVDRAIILEDDCLPEPSFFRFCEEMLDRYQHDERVHMIRGGNFLEGREVQGSSYYFSRWYHIWGWATWARAWNKNDVEMKGWPELNKNGWLERLLPSPLMVNRARQIFSESYAGSIDTWEYHWVFSSWKENALAISPAVNMVSNIGFRPDGTHLQDQNHPHSELPVAGMAFPLIHPECVEVNEDIDRLEWELLNSGAIKKPLLRRIIRKLRRIVTQ